jgi:hypothetical protein
MVGRPELTDMQRLALNEEVFACARETNHRHQRIARLLKTFGRIAHSALSTPDDARRALRWNPKKGPFATASRSDRELGFAQHYVRNTGVGALVPLMLLYKLCLLAWIALIFSLALAPGSLSVPIEGNRS